MTRTLMAAMFVAGLSAPAFAQTETPAAPAPQQPQQQSEMECSREAGAIWDAVQQSQLQDSQKTEVSQALQQAQAQEQQGNATACAQIVSQVKVALGLEPAPQGAAPTPMPN